MHLKSLGGMGQELIAPLVRLRLANLVRRASFGHGLALEALKAAQGVGFGLPCAALHG
jgi:hypothetical protein